MDFESPYTDPRVVNRGFYPIVFILIGRHAYQRTEWQAKEENRGYFPPVSIRSWREKAYDNSHHPLLFYIFLTYQSREDKNESRE